MAISLNGVGNAELSKEHSDPVLDKTTNIKVIDSSLFFFPVHCLHKSKSCNFTLTR